MLANLKGKNVLVLDIETTGFPFRKKGYFENIDNAYYDYKLNSKYDSSRIVEIAWSYIENYDKSKINKDNIKTFIRKPVDFKEIPNSDFHGITMDQAKKEGKMLSKILKEDGLSDALLNCDYIVGHCVSFDIYILLNELYRMKFNKVIDRLKTFLDTDKLVCTAKIGKTICQIPTPFGNLKLPKLEELYKHYYKKNPDNSHRSHYDVKSLLEILEKIE